MPLKKSSANQPKPAAEQPPMFQDGLDPVASAISIVDKKVRNLEKRRNKLQTLKASVQEGGGALDKDQKEAITRIKDVDLQLETVKDLQKQFVTLQTEYQKYRKRQQRQEKAQAKEAEREAEMKALTYSLRVQDMLNALGDEDKENFRTGSDGAAKLSEEELTQIDELYKLLNPTRENNPNFDADLTQAGEHFLQLKEASTKEILGTTYKNLREVLERMDSCGYFSRPAREGLSEQDSEEEDADDFKSVEEQATPLEEPAPASGGNFTEEVDIPPEVSPAVEAEPPTQYVGAVEVMNEAPQPLATGVNHVMGNAGMISQANSIMNYMPSAPSPTFPALGSSPILMTHEDGFSFMHESEVDRKQIHSPTTPSTPFTTSQEITHQAPPSQVQSQLVTQKVEYHAPYDGRGGVVSPPVEQGMIQRSNMLPNTIQNSATDVTTGQPNPAAVQPSYQSTVPIEATTGIMAPSVPPTGHDNRGVIGNPGVGGAIYSNVTDVSSGFRQQSSHQNKGGRGGNHGGSGGPGRRPGGGGQGSWGNKGNYNSNRNGRGIQGHGSYESRGYGGGGYQQQRGGGRPNYRTNSGGQKRS